MILEDSAKLLALMRRSGTRYTECVKITRSDGVIYRLTAHDEDLNVTDPVTKLEEVYTPANSVVFSSIDMSIGLAVTNMDINAAIDADDITSSELELGLFDDAKIELFIAYWADTRATMWPLRVGWVGNTNLEDIQVKLELRGIAQKLAQTFTDNLSLDCRYTFADSKCSLLAASFQTSDTVATVTSRLEFSLPIAVSDNVYQWGLCTFTSGLNAGQTAEIIHHQGTRIGLFLPTPYDIQTGDGITLLEGCPKTPVACGILRFNNLDNYGGEPFIAGSEVLQRYPNGN